MPPKPARFSRPVAADPAASPGRRRARILSGARDTAAGVTCAVVLGLGALVHHVYFDRRGLPDLEPFLRFEPPTIGEVYDARGRVLIELAREYRRVVSYDEVPVVLRDAILAAEDGNFFSHAGIEYRSLPRVVRKAAGSSLYAWWRGEGLRPMFPQGGSTLTQQLVRTYFLPDMTMRENDDAPIDARAGTRVLGAFLGQRAANKLLRKMEEIRLALWLESEMRRHYGSTARAKREIFARYASFIYLGNGRYGFAAASEYYFDKPLDRYGPDDAADAALLAGIAKSPRDYAPTADADRAIRRRNLILALMAREGFLAPEAAREQQAAPLRLSRRSLLKTEAPGAIANVLQEMSRHGGDSFSIEDLLEGRISVHSTIDARVQSIVNEALENGLAAYEERHPRSRGIVQGSVVVLRNADAAILAESGGRRTFRDRNVRYSDLNRATASLRQPGSAWKPLVYLAAFRLGLGLDSIVPDAPIRVSGGPDGSTKWIRNYDHKFKGPIPVRQALAESRNAVAIWLARQVGVAEINRTARALGIRTPLSPYISTALGASEVRLLELAGVYRALASGILAEPHVIAQVTDAAGGTLLYRGTGAPEPIETAPPEAAVPIDGLEAAGPPPDPIRAALPRIDELRRIQEGLRGVVRLPHGTAHALDQPDFGVPVMGKTGTTSDYRDALFIGSTWGTEGITVAVRIGFDDNRSLGAKETGARAALPVFREIMQRVYREEIFGPPPAFPSEIEMRIDACLGAGSPQRTIETLPAAATPADVPFEEELGMTAPYRKYPPTGGTP